VRAEHRERAERYLAERGGKAVFLGRFTAALRVMIPGLAGIARMPYRTFLAYNVAGGTTWATSMVLLGYLAGASWQRAASWASRIGLALLGLIVLVVLLRIVVHATRRRADRVRALAGRAAAIPPVARLNELRRAGRAWMTYRFPAETGWLARRLDPGRADGLAMTAVLALAALLGWTFGGLAQDVVADEGTVRYDPGVTAFAIEHRTGWLTLVMRNVTWLGSSWILVPTLVALTLVFWWRGRRGWVPLFYPWAAYLGAVVLYGLVKPLVARPRPPSGEMIGAASGFAFPSGHATQAVATWGMVALVLLSGWPARARAALIAGAVAVALLVGVSRVYLGTHWLTDVLGGYTLGAFWLAVLVAWRLRSVARTERAVPAEEPAGAS
jgi:membrane-associated phospholipid phosphatase